jgi:ankyrin repeat protein
MDINVQDSKGKTALMRAAESGDVDGIKALIAAGADLDTKHYLLGTALMMASMKDHMEIVKALVAAGSKSITEALIYAATKPDVDIVKFLIASGAEVNAEKCETALMCAACNGRTENVKVLIDSGADVNAKYSYVGTALIWAASHGHLEIVKSLIAAGTDVNAVNDEGTTALMNAANKGHEEIVKFLISSGADVKVVNDDYDSALTLAKSEDIKAILRAAGATSRNTFDSTIVAAKKGLLPAHRCWILYFKRPKRRDDAYKIMTSQFSERLLHIERRSTDRNVMYQHWIIVEYENDYIQEVYRVIEEAGCSEQEGDGVYYRTVLEDSFEVPTGSIA